MAGRGCTITIKLLRGSSSSSSSTTNNNTNTTTSTNTTSTSSEDLSLPVALHSPLFVLKEELATIVSIPTHLQVLILCDLTDRDRNSDILLAGRDHQSLQECGIRHGSVLTLHPLGMSAELRFNMTQQALADLQNPQVENDLLLLETDIPPDLADHSYNGIIVDLASNGPYEVWITSISIAGMLGHVRIFARDCPWGEHKTTPRPSIHYWAHQVNLPTDGWELVAEKQCRPSWDKPLQITLARPIRLLPYQRRGLYCHSNLPDDLGIQYQSYGRSDIVAANDHLIVYPGLGHTGSEPFDDLRGWYRSYRGLAGGIGYKAHRKGWSPDEHGIFPVALQRAVKTMLMCQSFGQSMSSVRRGIWSLSVDVILYILEFMHYDWFAVPLSHPTALHRHISDIFSDGEEEEGSDANSLLFDEEYRQGAVQAYREMDEEAGIFYDVGSGENSEEGSVEQENVREEDVCLEDDDNEYASVIQGELDNDEDDDGCAGACADDYDNNEDCNLSGDADKGDGNDDRYAGACADAYYDEDFNLDNDDSDGDGDEDYYDRGDF
eukprot:gene9872-10918_t